MPRLMNRRSNKIYELSPDLWAKIEVQDIRQGNIYESENGLLQRVNRVHLEIRLPTKVDVLLYSHPGLYKLFGFAFMAVYFALGD